MKPVQIPAVTAWLARRARPARRPRAIAAPAPHQAMAPDPAAVFLALVRHALGGGEAHLAAETGDLPDEPGRFGWDPWLGAAPRACGPCIGIAAGGSGDGRRVYLFPVAAYAAAEQAAACFRITLPMTLAQAGADLAARGLIITDPHDGGPVRRRLPSGTGRVWDMAASTLITGPNQDPAPQPPPSRPAGRN